MINQDELAVLSFSFSGGKLRSRKERKESGEIEREARTERTIRRNDREEGRTASPAEEEEDREREREREREEMKIR